MNIRRQSGFTVVEMILYMGLLMVFLAVMTSIFSSILDVQLESSATSAVDQDARLIFQRLSYDIARASAVNIPANPGDTGSTLQLTIGGQVLTYSLNGSQLLIADQTGTDRLNSIRTTVSGVTFTKIGNPLGKPTVRLSMTVTSTTQRVGGQFESRHVETTVGLR